MGHAADTRRLPRSTHPGQAGTVTLEGVAALALAFVLLALVVQVSFVVVARTAAESAAAATARRSARPGTDLADAARSLREIVEATVPGARGVEATADRSGTEAVATVRFVWDPPGPRLAPLTISVAATSPLTVPP